MKLGSTTGTHAATAARRAAAAADVCADRAAAAADRVATEPAIATAVASVVAAHHASRHAQEAAFHAERSGKRDNAAVFAERAAGDARDAARFAERAARGVGAKNAEEVFHLYADRGVYEGGPIAVALAEGPSVDDEVSADTNAAIDVAAVRSHHQASTFLDWTTAWLPPKIVDEVVGNAFERMEKMHDEGVSHWRVQSYALRRIFWCYVYTLRDVGVLAIVWRFLGS